MGKTIVKVKMWNIFDEEKIEKGKMLPLEVDSQVDNGAVRVILPKKIVDDLKLKHSGKTKVGHTLKVGRADMRVAKREVVCGLRIEILGRICTCDAIVEPRREIPLIGQIVLEDLDLWIDSKNGKLIPNPGSPDMPLLDEI